MSKRLGSIEHARTAATLRPNHTILPEGWKRLGSGCSRVAYLGPDGVVYKVCHRQGSRMNLLEERSYRALSGPVKEKTSGKARLAESRYFKSLGVLAMEYIPCVRPIMYYDEDEDDYTYDSDDAYQIVIILNRLGIYDIHTENVWIGNDGIITLFDYVC